MLGDFKTVNSDWNINRYLPLPLVKPTDEEEEISNKKIEEQVLDAYENIHLFANRYLLELEKLAQEKLEKAHASVEAIHLSHRKMQRQFPTKGWDFGVEINRMGASYGLIKIPIERGGFKVFSLAVDLKTGHLYAHLKIKVHDEDVPQFRYRVEKLQKETAIQRSLKGSAVPEIMHTCLATTKKKEHKYALKQFTMMEYCQRGDLYNHLSTNSSITAKLDPSSPYWLVIKDVLESLKSMQAKGLDHGDIKFENIFLTIDDQQNLRGRLGDFGASDLAAKRTEQELESGTIWYLAPEIYRFKRLPDQFKQAKEYVEQEINKMESDIDVQVAKIERLQIRNASLFKKVEGFNSQLEDFAKTVSNDQDRLAIIHIQTQKRLILNKFESNNKKIQKYQATIKHIQADRESCREAYQLIKQELHGEMHSIIHNTTRDEWAIGVLIYVMTQRSGDFLSKNTLQGISYASALGDEDNVKARCDLLEGEPLQFMIRRLLSFDPRERPSAAECLQMMQEIEKDFYSRSSVKE